MRALRYERFGSPGLVRIVEAPTPIPGPLEFGVRVAAASLNPVDWKIMRGDLRMVPILARPPRGVGMDFAGTVVSKGMHAEGFAIGDRVFGALSPFPRQGSLAETIVVAATRMAPIPDRLDFAGAASLPIAAGTAVRAVIDTARVCAGQRVAIVGAAGGVGGYAVQIAHHLGAHVSAICGGANADYVRSLGANVVIDYGTTDFTLGSGGFDAVFDAAGARSFGDVRRVLAPDGLYMTTLPSASSIAGAAWARLTSRQRCVHVNVQSRALTWRRLADLAHSGGLSPTIRQRIALEAVADALHAMLSGHGRGKIVVDVDASSARAVERAACAGV